MMRDFIHRFTVGDNIFVVTVHRWRQRTSRTIFYVWFDVRIAHGEWDATIHYTIVDLASQVVHICLLQCIIDIHYYYIGIDVHVRFTYKLRANISR